MLQGYLDESGIQDGAEICLVGGYFGGPGQWRKFGIDWSDVLTHFRVPEFHAKQFWAFDGKGQHVGPYRGWTQQKADQFIGNLASIIYEYRKKIHPVSTALVVDSFNRLPYNQRRFLTGGALRNGKFVSSGCPSKPYFLAFQSVVLDVAAHAPIGGKAHFAFDLNKQFKGYALELYALVKQTPVQVKDRLGKISFPTGLEAVQLQAADLFCYLDYHYCQRKLRNREAKPDNLLRTIMQGMLREEDFPFLDDDGLATLLEEVSIPGT